MIKNKICKNKNKWIIDFYDKHSLSFIFQNINEFFKFVKNIHINDE